jgi:hypothetical protein
MAYHGSGGVQNGQFKGKMIVIASLMDESAFPWLADWYRGKVKKNLGGKADDAFRLWYMDHAMHAETEGVQAKLHVVGYLGTLQQALLDIADWVEKGVAPPGSTNYTVQDAQVVVPADADARGGVQPVVALKANGGDCAGVAAGKPVTLNGRIAVPNGTGQVVSAEWDFEEQGTFETPAELRFENGDKTIATVETTHVFDKPGTYFPVLRAASNRSTDDPFTVIKNLARVRVVVL